MSMRWNPGFLAGLVLLAGACRAARAELRRFEVKGGRNEGVWRLTCDAAVRDEANYHNVQCWSPNGRYTCYTHWGGNDGAGGKASAEVHVVDLSTGEDRLVEKGINPRWANGHNWLFFCHFTGDGTKPYETGTQVIRYDADTGEKAVITHGMETPGGLDSTDTWLYGTQRFRGQKPPHVAVRVRNEPDSKLEVLAGAPNSHPSVQVNPSHPVLMMRAKDNEDPVYGTNRAWFDMTGGNVRQATVMAEAGHQSWSGDGTYVLVGNGQVRGRLWNEPFPSELHVLSAAGVGDVCPGDRAGRFACGGNLNMVDLRSGDGWHVLNPHSYIVYPMAGDFSTRYDIDPKGSPDGTKIHFHSTRDLEHPVVTRITGYDKDKPDSIEVESTDGFPAAGDIVCGWEVIGYAARTATAFEGLTRQKYGTRGAPDLVRKARYAFPLSAFVLSGRDRERAKPDAAMLGAGIPEDNPLLYQRQTDCYVVVVRRPFPPYLRWENGVLEVVPSEHHRELRGYRVLKDDRPLDEKLFVPGDAFTLSDRGEYSVAAVEWSGLASRPSAPIEIKTPEKCRILAAIPEGFSPLKEVWRRNGVPTLRERALNAARASMSLIHTYEGIIASEDWREGRRVSHVDINDFGKPIRHLEFHDNGKLKKRTYKTASGAVVSEEHFGEDGARTESITYDTRPDRLGQLSSRWWYDHGKPVKKTDGRGKVVFDKTGVPE